LQLLDLAMAAVPSEQAHQRSAPDSRLEQNCKQEVAAKAAAESANVLTEVLAELRAKEALQDSVSTGAGRQPTSLLAQAALEEASALDAIVSWYRQRQQPQIDDGLEKDGALGTPPAQPFSRAFTAAAELVAEQARSVNADPDSKGPVEHRAVLPDLPETKQRTHGQCSTGLLSSGLPESPVPLRLRKMSQSGIKVG
jgi:hypothetical protein